MGGRGFEARRRLFRACYVCLFSGYGAVWKRAAPRAGEAAGSDPAIPTFVALQISCSGEMWQSGECGALLRRSRRVSAAGSSPAISAGRGASHSLEFWQLRCGVFEFQ